MVFAIFVAWKLRRAVGKFGEYFLAKKNKTEGQNDKGGKLIYYTELIMDKGDKGFV